MKNPAKYPKVDEVMMACNSRETSLDNPGFCLACGEAADGCEPDACNYTCEACGEDEVFGAEEVLMMGATRA